MSEQTLETQSCWTGRSTLVTFARITGVAVLALSVAAGVLAAQTTALSSAFGESVNVRVLPLLGGGIPLTSGPLPLAAGTAAPAFDHASSLASITVAPALTGPLLATRLLAVHAASGVPGVESVEADATVDNLALNLVGHLPLLTLGADVVRSTAGLAGSCADGPELVGTTSIVNARVAGLLGLGLSVSASPAPNTVLLSAPGLRVVLNEQIETSGAGVSGLTVNAIHVSLYALPVAGLGLLSGDIVLSQSHVEIACSRSSADLGIHLAGSPDPVPQGGVLTYALSVANAGPDAAEQVVVTDLLPNGVTFFAASPSQGTCSGTSPVVCDLGSLQPGDEASISIDVRADSPGLVTDAATVASATPDPNLADNQASVTTTIANGGPVELTGHARKSRSAARPPA
jgi:uncharacterized repeat protein (TIGR01451 family)